MTKSPPLPFIILVHGQETAITLSTAKYIGYKYPGGQFVMYCRDININKSPSYIPRCY